MPHGFNQSASHLDLMQVSDFGGDRNSLSDSRKTE